MKDYKITQIIQNIYIDVTCRLKETMAMNMF